ncbi:MAG: hypothetical protein Kow0099_14040 [Candidatus Abyssubacteria bacterium]
MKFRIHQRFTFSLLALLLSVSLVLLLSDMLSLYVTGDLAAWLHRYRFAFPTIFTRQTNPYHYHPLSLALVGLPLSIVGFKPFWIHLNLLVIHLLNALLVFRIAVLLLQKTSHALCATILFSASMFVPETIIANPPASASTLTLLICFLLFRRYGITRAKTLYVGSCLAFAVSLFTYPTAMNFVVVLFFYLVCDPEGIFRAETTQTFSGRVRGIALLLIPFALLAAAFLIVRAEFGCALSRNSPNLLRADVLAKFLERTLTAFDMVLTPSQFIRAIIPAILVPTRAWYLAWSSVFMTAVLAAALIKSSPRDRFLVGWLAANIVLVAFETDVRCCHLYFPSIAASLLLTAALYKVSRWILDLVPGGKSPFKNSGLFSKTGVATLMTVSVLVIPIKNNLVNINYFMGAFMRASDIARASVEYINSVENAPKPGQKTLLINMPAVLLRKGSISAFVLPHGSLLYLSDLERDENLRARNYAVGICKGLFSVERSSSPDFTGAQYELDRKAPAYSVSELRQSVAQSDSVFIFDYTTFRPVLLTLDMLPLHASRAITPL